MTVSKEKASEVQAGRLEKLKKTLQEEQTTSRPDDSKVIIAEMQLNALLKLSDDSNRAFSQVRDSERFDVDRALIFSKSALPSITERLQKRGIAHTFTLPILTDFIEEYFRLGHCVDRNRVEEYLKGLQAIAPKTGFMQEEPPKRSIMSRII